MCVVFIFAVLIHTPSFFNTKISLTVLDVLQCYFHFFCMQAETRISSISQKNAVIWSIRVRGKEAQMPQLNLGGKKSCYLTPEYGVCF